CHPVATSVSCSTKPSSRAERTSSGPTIATMIGSARIPADSPRAGVKLRCGGSRLLIGSWRIARAPLLLLACTPLPAVAGDVRITTSVGSSVIATDNVDLEPRDQATNGLIWTNSASLDVSSTGDRFKGALDYTLNIESTFSDHNDVRFF